MCYGHGGAGAIVKALVALLRDFAAHEQDSSSAMVDPNALREALSCSGLDFKTGAAHPYCFCSLACM